MIQRSNGHRYINYDKWDVNYSVVVKKYDYAKNGLLKHIISHVIYDAAVDENGNYKDNPFGNLLKYMETSFVICMKFVERMQNFKNYAYFKY